jgi:predicted DNA-binding transcriptional regulator YafY
VLETSARLLRLLSVLQARRDWPGAELAERLEVDVRIVRRDVDRLRQLGYSVHSVSGPTGCGCGSTTWLTTARSPAAWSSRTGW